MLNTVKHLPLRQSDDGKWEVENNPGNWIKCETKADAEILSNAPIVLHESYEAFNPDESLADRLDRTAEKMEQYNISFGARFFRNRAELMRGN